MLHTAQRGTMLAYVCEAVAAMKPGECLCVSAYDLRDAAPSFWHGDTLFTPADRVLGNIIGSCYTHSYTEDMMNGTITFRRHEDTGQRRHSDPDRR